MSNDQVPWNPISAIREVFLCEKELARRHGLSIKTLQKYRHTGDGGYVPFRKFGARVRYALSDVLIWEASTCRASTSDPGS